MVAMLFDLDGTLVDTVEDIRLSLNHVMKLEGCSPIGHEETRAVVGRGLRNALRGAFSYAGKEVDEAKLEKDYQELVSFYGEHAVTFSRPYEGIVEMLERLSGKGIVMGILSNKKDSIVQEIVRILLPGIPFAFVQGAIEGQPLKPHAEAVWQFAKQAAVPRESILLVGDSEVDYQTMQEARGTKGIFVTWGFRDRSDLEKGGVAPLVDNTEQLEELIYGID